MEERRRIIIPTGVERDHSLPVPQFDTEATLLARPVVPLVEAQQRPARTKLLLALVVVAASLVGAAAALAFDSFRNHTHQNAPVAQQPANAPASVPQATQPEPPEVNVAPPKTEDHQATVPAKPSPDERATGDGDSWTRDEPGAGDRAAKKSRAERRRRNDNEYGPEEVQRQVERAGRELNRIREIFEGRQQPQQPPE